MADTIAAIATGGDISAIGIIRMSGDEAISIAARVFEPYRDGRLEESRDRELVLGKLSDRRGEVIDICLCTISRAPNSYTGEHTAEFQCHGSPLVLRETLESLFAQGARQALAGEFTKRAFLNGRMDLTQAEAVVDLIDAETAEAAKNAAGQLDGAMLSHVGAIYDQLVDIASHFHAVIDYPDEDIEDFELRNYADTVDESARKLKSLLDTFERGRYVKNGILTAIMGRPNVGKSSLLNAIIGYDRAIVTEIPGTTRDTIEEKALLGGVLLRLTDTAGLRGTDDPVERLGVDRSLRAAGESELVLAVFDGSEPISPEDMEVIRTARAAPRSIALVNKIDLPRLIDDSVLTGSFATVIHISAVNGSGLDNLDAAVRAIFPAANVTGTMLTNLRQVQAVQRAYDSMCFAIEALRSETTPDAVLTDIEAAMLSLGELTGKSVSDDVVAKIFERFCVGK